MRAVAMQMLGEGYMDVEKGIDDNDFVGVDLKKQ